MEVKIMLPELYEKQQEIKNDTSRFKVICAGRRVGKTVLVTDISVNAMLQGKRVCYITPTFLLADEIYDKVLAVFPDKLISNSNKSNRKISIKTGGWITFFSGEALSRSRGLEYDLIIVDEAAHIPDLQAEWNASLRQLILKTKGSAYFISTPYGRNFFFSLFQRGVNLEHEFKSWQFSSYENPHLPKDELDAMVHEIPEAVYRQEILAEPMENAANPFGTHHIRSNTLSTLSTAKTVVYGIDLAKYNDWTVIVGLDIEGKMTYFDRFQKPWEMTKKAIETLQSDILKVVDSTGVGDVIYEALQQTCSNIQGFKFTTESKPKMMYQLIKDVEEGKLKFNEQTASEMQVFEYKFSSTGHIKFQAQSGFHDDCIMALAVANQFKNQAVAASAWKLYSA